jgi:hypothetical protein
MSRRNAQKRLAKARKAELLLAVKQAFALEAVKQEESLADWKDACSRYRDRTQDALSSYRHKAPSEKLGKVQGGKFVPSAGSQPATRTLVYCPKQKKEIERKKSAIG